MDRLASLLAWLRRHLLFTLIVLVPGILVTLYYGIIASDIYVSESRFLVRNPQHASATGGVFGQLLTGTGISRSTDDTSAVHDYILSRDALRELQDELRIRDMYTRQDASFIDRFPGLYWDSSFEEFFRYYGKRIVNIDMDTSSSISVLTVQAFTAEDARRINNQLLEMSERLVNELNDRSRDDMIRFADHEVALASEKAKEASVRLLNYRSNAAVFQPDKQAALQLEQVARIQQELISTEAQIAQLRRISPENPQIGSLQGRAESLRSAIASEASKVTSSRNSFSANAPEFERLELDVTFADKQLGVALAELEAARSEAQQKQLYLERLVQPNLPDKAMEPHRLRSIFAFIIMSLIVWGVASVVVASVREHAD